VLSLIVISTIFIIIIPNSGNVILAEEVFQVPLILEQARFDVINPFFIFPLLMFY